MCGIAGIFDKKGGNAAPILRPMIESITHRGPDGYGLCVANTIQRVRNLEELDFSISDGDWALGHTRLAIVGGLSGIQPFEGCKEGLVILHNGEIYNYKALRKQLEPSHTFETLSDSETIVHLMEDHYSGNLTEALAESLMELDGVFALAASDGHEMAIARDVMGIKQLYTFDGPEFVAFASERKALWTIGIKNYGERLPPGHVASISKSGLNLRRFREPPLRERSNIITESQEAIEKYVASLRGAVSKRVEDMNDIGVIFSGGVDSVFIAKLVKDEGKQFTCYCAGTENSSDLRQAELAASKLGAELKVKKLDVGTVENYIPKIIKTIEDRSLGQVEVALPVYAAVELAHNDGVRVMLTGQAPDELFAGYPWYRIIAEEEGYASLTRRMIDDLLMLYKETLEREDKITMAHSIELRVPYLDLEVVRVATSITTKLKLPPNDTLGKHIHREAAMQLGVPKELAFAVKQAAQHGAGIHYLMEELAAKHGFDQALADSIGYSARKSIHEVLGSSQRYGHMYSKDQKWKTPDCVQLYLDTVAYEEHLTNEEDRTLLEMLLRGTWRLNLFERSASPRRL